MSDTVIGVTKTDSSGAKNSPTSGGSKSDVKLGYNRPSPYKFVPKEPDEGPHLRLPQHDDDVDDEDETLFEYISSKSQVSTTQSIHGKPAQEQVQKHSEDMVNHPPHYSTHPSGIECIDVVEHMNFNLGNAMKYIWRTDKKDTPEENIKKAIWYCRRELKRRGIKE